MKNKGILFIISSFVLVVIFIVASLIYKNYEEKRLGFLAKENSKLFIRDHSPRLGSENAKV